MNFITFPVRATNIFPIANSTAGGQLVTEFNLRSRESVGVGPHPSATSIDYMIGPSYVHAQDDFEVNVQKDGSGKVISSSMLEIAPGRAVINGHYVECLATMTVDILKANNNAKKQGQAVLKGDLCIGLRAMYSTLPTLAGTIRVENKDDMYEGIQVVILPKSEFKLPVDVPKSPDRVTAHIKLAEFSFVNGTILSVVNNYPEKCRYVPADRIANVDNLLSSIYLSKKGLNPKKLYTFAGKGANDKLDGRDTWCDSTDSLIVWDNNPKLTYSPPAVKEARFGVASDRSVQLYMPHKQIDGMTDSSGNAQYYMSKSISLPIADFEHNTSGTVDRNYTQAIKTIRTKLNNIYRMPNGKQVGYVEQLSSRDELPPILYGYNPGDYVVVGEDLTVDSDGDSVRAPSTMYVVLPGVVTHITPKERFNPSYYPGAVQLASTFTTDSEINVTDYNEYGKYWELSEFRGVVDRDFFTMYNDNISAHYQVDNAGKFEYSEPIFLTGQIPFATDEMIGGFLNISDPDSVLDNGYVYLDDTGHLKLADYGLLRSGTLAYQLGDDVELDTGLSNEEVQAELNEYVNERVAFPNANHIQNSTYPNVINVTLNLSAEDAASQIYISSIDSRFGASVYLHIKGDATSNTTINIVDCEKIRIDNNIGGSPVINLYRSTLYYDSTILSRLNTIQDMRLWYTKFEDKDPDIIVDHMTVRELTTPQIVENIDYWTTSTPNDNHYTYALHSLTFSSDGSIIGIELYVQNEASTNVSLGRYIISSPFEIPQGASLTYPINRVTHKLKVTGSFVTSYPTDSGYMVIETDFTALSQVYSEDYSSNVLKGTISFLTDASIVNNFKGFESGTSIDGWESRSFNLFTGGMIS